MQDNQQAQARVPNLQSASRSGIPGRTAAGAACQAGVRDTLSAAARMGFGAGRAGHAGAVVIGFAGDAAGIVAGIVAVGIARWGLGGRLGAGLRR